MCSKLPTFFFAKFTFAYPERLAGSSGNSSERSNSPRKKPSKKGRGKWHPIFTTSIIVSEDPRENAHCRRPRIKARSWIVYLWSNIIYFSELDLPLPPDFRFELQEWSSQFHTHREADLFLWGCAAIEFVNCHIEKRGKRPWESILNILLPQWLLLGGKNLHNRPNSQCNFLQLNRDKRRVGEHISFSSSYIPGQVFQVWRGVQQ